MTSIEWLVKELFLEDTIYRYNLKVIEQAKEMHKQEIKQVSDFWQEDIPELSDEEIDDITNDIYADSIKVLPYTKFGIEEIAEHFTRGLKMYRQKIKEKNNGKTDN